MSEGGRGGARLARFGPSAALARQAVVALHGRGGDGRDMASLFPALGFPDVAVFAPEAAGRSWWPTSFLAPIDLVGPRLAAAIVAVEHAFEAAEAEGFDRQTMLLVGFSQGGCLALEFAARKGPALKGVFALSAGLIGTADTNEPPTPELYGHVPKTFDYATRLDRLAVRISVHERDPHIPLRRARESADVLSALGAAVTLDVEPGSGHSVTQGDAKAMRAALQG